MQGSNMKNIKLNPGKNDTSFTSNGNKLAGNVYCPDNFDSSAKYPAITLAGPLGSVKEQAAGTFAEKLCGKGFITLAFDFSTQGESEGEPRNYDNPFSKGDDIQNAISFLGTLDCVDGQRIGAAGICAGASYTAHGIVSDRRIKAFATVVAHFSLREFTGYNPMISDDMRAMLLKQSNDARQSYFQTGVAEQSGIIYPDAKSKEELPFTGSDADDIYDYYYTRVTECWPNFQSQMATMSYDALIKSHALDFARDFSIPYLGVVGSEAFSKPYTERFIDDVGHDRKELIVVDGARHIQCYDVPAYVDQATENLSRFFHENL
jgi:fermentation-respiration switch protein FrsA (DUF1100 family)